MKKDVVLIIWWWGMSWVFSAWVLKSFEDAEMFDRIDSVYAVSVWACTGARFLLKQSELWWKTFYTRFHWDDFMKLHFLKYYFQALMSKFFWTKVEDLINFEYFEDIILRSEDKIDMNKIMSSKIKFYVKVFNCGKREHEYLLVNEWASYEKIMASASMTPLTSKKHSINNEMVFDWDTIHSDIEEKIIQNNEDKLIIKIVNSNNSLRKKYNPFVLFVLYTLLLATYWYKIANKYFLSFFKQWRYQNNLKKYSNLILIQNDDSLSSFCKSEEVLKAAYEKWVEKWIQVGILRNG